ncbi:uncharacterized protein J4E78_003262 [Alternaria triticimaculans]|uniref:uncharacterized protein n=1 Tax=Alternaria triticimaculans TaxID=297637 RepID=UPI0020C54C04|nr:uncharacterized protein J4E78_003262 [Alternaria triticimaculans]KAI4665797.1 hypothetical protein J4E78_003262 [Alternaria triticimaculans]
MSAPETTIPDRALHDAIIVALSLDAQSEKEEALTAALKSWKSDDDETRSPHLLVHVLQNMYELPELPTALKNQDASDYDTLKKVCKELKFTLLFASVKKLLGCNLYVENRHYRRWEKSRPKIDPKDDTCTITVDQLKLMQVVDLKGKPRELRLPVRDTEVTQKEAFTHETAKIEIEDGGDEMEGASEASLFHHPEGKGIEAALFMVPGFEYAKAEPIVKLLNEATEKVRAPDAGPASLPELQRLCKLLLEYHDPGHYRKERQVFMCARFPLIPGEVLDQLTAVCIELGSADLWQKAMEQLSASFQRQVRADLTIGAIGRLVYKTKDAEHLKKADGLVKSQNGIKKKMEMCDSVQAAYDRARDAEDKSAQSIIPAAMATWRASIIRETVPGSRFISLRDCLPLLENGRELEDAFIHDTLCSMAKCAGIDVIEAFLKDVAKLNGKVPDADIQRYCNIVLGSSASTLENVSWYHLRSMRKILQHHLSVAEPAIREYCLKKLGAPTKKPEVRKGKVHDDEVGDFVLISQTFGEEVLSLLLPHLGGFLNDVPWLVQLLIQVKDSEEWASETFLPQFCTTVLEPAVERAKLVVSRPDIPVGEMIRDSFPFRKNIAPVRGTNEGDRGVTMEELKLLIPLLKHLTLDHVVDRLAQRMLMDFVDLDFESFRDVLGEEKTDEMIEKKRAIEEAKEAKKRKAADDGGRGKKKKGRGGRR